MTKTTATAAVLAATLAGAAPAEAQGQRESVAVPAATFTWTGDPGRDRASVRQECATHGEGVPVGDCDDAYERVQCAITEIVRAWNAFTTRGSSTSVVRDWRNRDDGQRRLASDAIETPDGAPFALDGVDPDEPPELFPYIDFDAGQARAFVAGVFVECAEEVER